MDSRPNILYSKAMMTLNNHLISSCHFFCLLTHILKDTFTASIKIKRMPAATISANEIHLIYQPSGV